MKVAVLDLYIAKRKLKHSKAALKREKVDIQIWNDDDIEDDEDKEDNDDPNSDRQTLKKRIFPIFCRPQDRGEFVELGWEEHEFLTLHEIDLRNMCCPKIDNIIIT
ncbi:Hypothetical predicted protein [Paramuricea clavata]|uniref:Uncharacterized protein n=1 Tax=Paramuricea clavata TaxID=317549 RepID=A0A6S7J4F4_PARCT|nr:Hypothetical predicted protein [Paramuricea clavata]